MTTPTTPTTKHAEQRPDNAKPTQTMQQKPQTTTVVQQQKPADQKHPEPQKSADPKQVQENTKPQDQGGGDQDPHPSPITDPTNAPPEPAQWSDENPRPPLAVPGTRDYVAGQPVDQEEYEKTERQAAERVRPEAWERLEGQGVEVKEGMKDASVGWDRDEGTRPDGKRLRDPGVADDDVNKRPGGVGGQGTRADGRARAPD